MDFRAQTGALRLLTKVLDEKMPTEALVEVPSNKPKFQHRANTARLARAVPEAVGLSSMDLRNMVAELHAEPTLDMHGLMLARGGKVVLEADFGAYTNEVWRATYSLCKSVVGIAAGILWDEGRLNLDAKVHSFFEGKVSKISNLTQGGLTVRHLLTMRSGALFNEAGAVTLEDWVKGFLDSVMKFEPGAQFDYNSMNSHILASIIQKITGQSVMEYLRPRLLEPLGIGNIYWETCPSGVEKGGWGLYMLAEDELKLGQLFLNRGLWDGKRILSEEWIDMATAVQSETPAHLGNYDYGFHLWVGRKQRVWLFNGMFGQNVFIYPDTGIVLVTAAGNSESFQQGAMFEIIERYFAQDVAFADALAPDDASYMALLETLTAIRQPVQKSSLPASALRPYLGVYQTAEKHAASVGILPLLEQAVQNSYTRGLHAMMLKKTEGGLTLTFFEGDKRIDLPVDLDEPRTADLTLCGQYHHCAVTAVLTTDEDEHTVLKLRISFLEIPNVRLIKLVFRKNAALLKMQELPGRDYVMDSVDSFLNQTPGGKILSPLASKLDSDFVIYKVERAFEPALLFNKTE